MEVTYVNLSWRSAADGVSHTHSADAGIVDSAVD